jgi:nucleoid-associated protein YgaU
MVRNKAVLASEILGLGPGGGGLSKLRIHYDGHDSTEEGPIEALFNPQELNRSRSISWSRQNVRLRGYSGRRDTRAEFLEVEPETLSVDLFFDTYESREYASGWKAAAAFVQPLNPFQASDAVDVTTLTDRVVKLAEVDRNLHRPPICRLMWGAYTDIFTGVLSQLDQRFTMFLADGTPVRATLSCTFEEHDTKAHRSVRELYSPDVVKTRRVRKHDTLHSIAAEEYADPALWRHIAVANGIVNPRAIQPGMVLTIPKLT